MMAQPGGKGGKGGGGGRMKDDKRIERKLCLQIMQIYYSNMIYYQFN